MIDICMALNQSVSPHTGVRTIQNTGVFWQAVFQRPRPHSLFLNHGSAAKTLTRKIQFDICLFVFGRTVSLKALLKQRVLDWDQVRFSGKLPTYPSPKPTFCPQLEVSVNVGLGEG